MPVPSFFEPGPSDARLRGNAPAASCGPHAPSAPGKLLNVGLARCALPSPCIVRGGRCSGGLGFAEYDRAIPVPDIFQVRCLETDELFDSELYNAATASERKAQHD
jgi:hypothetical protein